MAFKNVGTFDLGKAASVSAGGGNTAVFKTAITSSLNRKENRDDSKRIKTGTHNSGESRIDGKGTPQNPF